MVDGPFTLQQAAEACQCPPEDLCPGPLGAVQEADKVRTIYDGSVGGQNALIQAHTKEKTTMPTAADCMQAIHWCQAAVRARVDSVAMCADTNSGWIWPDSSDTWVLLKSCLVDTTDPADEPRGVLSGERETIKTYNHQQPGPQLYSPRTPPGDLPLWKL